ncbi:hypothetical protein [Rahnella sikkimica]|uniref:hypothetical protein n=1 Tax=Rahnella sikkimica TaxID=1805933 RepID=UPI00186593CB|nr:hypothetical protein [Rahnella sikkimica]
MAEAKQGCSVIGMIVSVCGFILILVFVNQELFALLNIGGNSDYAGITKEECKKKRHVFT